MHLEPVVLRPLEEPSFREMPSFMGRCAENVLSYSFRECRSLLEPLIGTPGPGSSFSRLRYEVLGLWDRKNAGDVRGVEGEFSIGE